MKIFVERLRPQGAGLIAYLHDKSPELSTASVRPAILIFPGGGYYSCPDREAEPIALAYLAEGYNSFVCRYYVGTQNLFADAFEDAQTAMALLHSKCEEWNIYKNRIAAVGFSAGGHLASAISTMGNIRPAALILGYPVILENMGQLLGKEIPCTNECVDDTTPPTFIFATRDDDTVSKSPLISQSNCKRRAASLLWYGYTAAWPKCYPTRIATPPPSPSKATNSPPMRWCTRRHPRRPPQHLPQPPHPPQPTPPRPHRAAAPKPATIAIWPCG